MTPPALATITGECWGNQGGAYPGATILTPASLDERDGPVDWASRVRAVAHADASLTLLDGSPVRLWPGLWECLMPDGQTWQFLAAAGQTYTLAYLRGQVLTLVELSGVDAVGLPYGTPPTYSPTH